VKKLILVICLFFFSIQLVFSKETRTRFGIYIDLPENYISVSANLDDLMKQDDQEIINKDFFNELATGSSKSDMNIEYFFPTKKYDPEFNNIYITSTEGNIKEFMAYDLSEICKEMNLMLNELFNKQLKQYACKFNPSEVDKKNSAAVYYFDHEGVFNNQRVHMYYFQTSSGLTTFALACQNRNCNTMKKDLINIINSRSE